MTVEERRKYKADWERRRHVALNGVPVDTTHVYRPRGRTKLGIVAAGHAEYMRQWRMKRRPYRLAEKKAFRARARAKRLGISVVNSFTAGDVLAQFAEQDGRCWWCSVDLGECYHVDHLVPLCRGGPNTRENLVASCQYCNDSKGRLLPEEFLARQADRR